METGNSQKYFVMIDGEQRGPYSLEELGSVGVRPSTYVWCDGMDDWEKAEDNADICRMFRIRLHNLMHPSSVEAEQIRQSDSRDFPLKDINPSPTRYDYIIQDDEPIPTLEEIDARQDTSIPPTPMIGFAVLSAVFFCLPTGLVAIYFAVKSRNAWKKGENKTAYDFNRSAKMWTGISFFLGLILFAFIMRMFL